MLTAFSLQVCFSSLSPSFWYLLKMAVVRITQLHQPTTFSLRVCFFLRYLVLQIAPDVKLAVIFAPSLNYINQLHFLFESAFFFAIPFAANCARRKIGGYFCTITQLHQPTTFSLRVCFFLRCPLRCRSCA